MLFRQQVKGACLVALFLWGGLPASGGIQEQPMPYLDEDLPAVWQPAPTPPGATDWSILTDIDVREEEIGNLLEYVPTFTPAVKALHGTRVKINGYMVPLEASDRQSHFILMAYPHACPFHMPGGPGGFIEVQADFPVEFTYDPILIEGHFQVLEDFSMGIFYRITAANAAPNQ